jgi:hypothetical protein
MGSISFQVVGDGTVGTRTKTFTLPDAHINRFIAWAKAAYPESGTPIPNPGPGQPDFEVPTTVQALNAWANSLMAGTKKNVQRFETPAPVVPGEIEAA